MSISLKDIDNENTLNIFTDASIRAVQPSGYIGCYGALCVSNGCIIDQSYVTIGYTTNNNAEIKAIREGIGLALRYGAGKQINLFSDSQICIFGLRERILRWGLTNGRFIGSMGQDIANQEIFMEIVQMMLDHQLQINFLHQAGHVVFTAKSLKDAAHVFRTSNGIRGIIDMNLIRYISNYNNIVDDTSRKQLGRLTACDCHDPIRFFPHEFDKNLYTNLIKKRYS